MPIFYSLRCGVKMSIKIDYDYASHSINGADFDKALRAGEFRGVVANMPSSVYHSIETGKYVSSTQLKYMYSRSPYHYYTRYIEKSDPAAAPTEAMKKGSVVHGLLLEPHKFDEEFFVYEACDLRTKEGKEKKIRACHEARGRVMIDDEDFSDCQKIVEGVRSNSEAIKLLSEGVPELAIFWRCPFSGLLMKAKVDSFCDKYFLEFKTAKDVSPFKFSRDAFQMHYDLSLSHYQKGIETVLSQTFGAYMIAVENEAPYRCEVFEVTSEFFETGHNKWLDAVSKLERGMSEGKWPGYKDDRLEGFLKLMPPAWSVKSEQIDEA